MIKLDAVFMKEYEGCEGSYEKDKYLTADELLKENIIGHVSEKKEMDANDVLLLGQPIIEGYRKPKISVLGSFGKSDTNEDRYVIPGKYVLLYFPIHKKSFVVDMDRFAIHIDGKVTLETGDLVSIHNLYERMTIAEFIMENHNVPKDKALDLAKRIRELIDDYDFTETEAIDKILYNK